MGKVHLCHAGREENSKELFVTPEWFDEKLLKAIVNDEEVAVLLVRTAVPYHRSEGY